MLGNISLFGPVRPWLEVGGEQGTLGLHEDAIDFWYRVRCLIDPGVHLVELLFYLLYLLVMLYVAWM